MNIIRLEINSFGPLKDKTFVLSDGLNVIVGDNESGKSTLLLFIKYMIYGIAKKQRGSAVAEADRVIPRDGDSASGALTLEQGGKTYRIERRLTRNAKGSCTDKVQVKDVDSGNRLDIVPEELVGIPYDVFESSCMVAQLGCASVDGEKVGTLMRNMLGSADESVDAKKIIKNLDLIRVKYLHKGENGGSVYNLRQQKAELEQKYRYAVEDSVKTDSIKADTDRIDAKIEEVAAKQRIADDLVAKIEQRTVLKLFDKLHEYEKLADENKKTADELSSRFAVDGVLPDRGVLARYSSALEELRISVSSLEQAQGELDERRARGISDDEMKLLENAARLGGLDVILSTVGRYKKKRSTFGVISVISLVLGIALLALGILSIPILSVAMLIPLLGCIALIASSTILFFIMRVSHGRKIAKVFAELGVDPYSKELEAIFEKIKGLIALEEKKTLELKKLGETLYIRQNMLSSVTQKASDLLRKRKITVEPIESKAVMDTLEGEIANLSRFCDEIERLHSERTNLNANISELSGELSDYNEHKLRHQLSNSASVMTMSEAEIREAKREKNYYELQLKALGERKLSNDRALLERKYTTEDPFDISSRLSQVSERLEAEERIYDVLELTINSLTEAASNLRSAISPRLRAGAGGYMEQFSGGKYRELCFDDNLEMSMDEDGFSYPIDSFSTGTKDMAYLSMRLAMLDILSSVGTLPLLMDETFAMVDDKRASRILSILSDHAKNGGQSVLFSCHNREKRLCNELGIELCEITL